MTENIKKYFFDLKYSTTVSNMKFIILLVMTSIIFFSCENSKLSGEYEKLFKQYQDLKQELDKIQVQYNNCQNEVEELKNTPEQRFLRAQKYFSEENLSASKTEYQEIVDKFTGTELSKKAALEIKKIDSIIEKKKKEEERKKVLGFKILKESSKVKVEDLTLNFSKIWIGKQWVFDSYEGEYHYRDSERGTKYILAKLSISSESKNPLLPPIYAYHIKNGELKYLGKFGYEFRRWEDYGSYLGNYADYGNDFAHTKTISFSIGYQEKVENIDDEPLFIIVGNKGTFKRRDGFYRPAIIYSDTDKYSKKFTLTVDDFGSDYILVKIFNKSKL